VEVAEAPTKEVVGEGTTVAAHAPLTVPASAAMEHSVVGVAAVEMPVLALQFPETVAVVS
jgi:hypothetical protein